MLVLTSTENTTPRIAAIAVSATAIQITSCCRCNGRHGIGLNERKHVGSNAIDLLVEFVTQGVDAGKAIGDTRGISAIE
jgi:hypothetical protein